VSETKRLFLSSDVGLTFLLAQHLVIDKPSGIIFYQSNMTMISDEPILPMAASSNGAVHHHVATVSPANSPPPSPTTVKSSIDGSKLFGAARRASKSGSTRGKTASNLKRQLAPNFEPSEYSVICGRGKECFDSEGVSVSIKVVKLRQKNSFN
jgi:hypothetical protein